MGIKRVHGKPETQLRLAAKIGQAKEAARLKEKQMEIDYQTNLRQQQLSVDLQMQERARMWEIEKMEMASRMDFMREEQARQRKLDSFDNAIQQIDKEVLAGRMTEQEAYPFKLKYEMNKMGVDMPISALPKADEERYGVRPYYLEPEFERDYPELAEAKKREAISGERRGVVPYYLDPTWLRTTDRDVVEQVLAAREIFFDTPEELDAFIERVGGGLPLGDKSLDVGIQTGIREGVEQIRVISPAGEEGTIPAEDLEDALAEGYTEIPESLIESPVEEGVPFGPTTPPPLTLYRLLRQYYKIPREVRKARRKEKTRKAVTGSPLYRAGR